MSEIQRIAELSAQVLEGDAWHADSIAALLRRTTAEQASTRIAEGTHTIWEIVVHVTGWVGEIRGRLAGEPAGTPPVGDWPDPGELTAARWDDARAALLAAYRQLQDDLKRLADEDLARPVVDRRHGGTEGASRYVTAHGIVHHAIYHAGQIAIIRKALSESTTAALHDSASSRG